MLEITRTARNPLYGGWSYYMVMYHFPLALLHRQNKAGHRLEKGPFALTLANKKTRPSVLKVIFCQTFFIGPSFRMSGAQEPGSWEILPAPAPP